MEIRLFYNPDQGARTLHATNIALSKKLRAMKAISLGSIDIVRPVSKSTYITALGEVTYIDPDKLDALHDPIQWMFKNTIRVKEPERHSELMVRMMLGYELIPVRLQLATTTHDANVLYATPPNSKVNLVGNEVRYDGEMKHDRVRKLIDCGFVELPRLLLDREVPILGATDERARVRWRLTKRS